MGEKEREIINEILLEGSKTGRLFRVNAGSGFQGTDIKKLKVNKAGLKEIINDLFSLLKKANIKLKDVLILINPRFFKGLPAGVHDIIGWETHIISKSCCGSCYHFDFCYKEINLEGLKIAIKNNGCKNYHPNKCEKIAVFKSVEVKTGKQKLSEKQENWKRQVIEAGGIYEERRG